MAIVTGANRGIGLQIARELASREIRTVLCSRDLEKGKEAASKLALKKITVVPAQLDVTDQNSVDALARKVQSDFGRVDILVNNAGILIDDRLVEKVPSKANLDKVVATFRTNVVGPWRLCKAFVPLMRKNHYGRIVNVSSGSGTFESLADPSYAPAYSLSKTGLNGFTLMLATELRGTGILVNAVCPGWVRTDMGGRNAPRSVVEGADTAVWLAMLPENGPTGLLFRDRKQIQW